MTKTETQKSNTFVSTSPDEAIKAQLEKYGKAYSNSHKKEDELNRFLKDFKTAGGAISFLDMTEEQAQAFTAKQTALKRSTNRLQTATTETIEVLSQAGYKAGFDAGKQEGKTEEEPKEFLILCFASTAYPVTSVSAAQQILDSQSVDYTQATLQKWQVAENGFTSLGEVSLWDYQDTQENDGEADY